jgi:hypothetical protein
MVILRRRCFWSVRRSEIRDANCNRVSREMPYTGGQVGQVPADIWIGASKVKTIDQLSKRATVAAANPRAATAAYVAVANFHEMVLPITENE